MKAVLQILGGAFAAFLLAAFVQEWEVFGPWLRGARGGDPAGAAARADAVREAEATVRAFVAIQRHLYATEGDPRFAERLPAAPGVVADALADVAFLRSRGQRQEPELLRLEVLSADAPAADRVEVRTKEYWVFRAFGRGGEILAPRSAVVHARYLVRLDGTAWRVDGWEPEPPPAADDGA